MEGSKSRFKNQNSQKWSVFQNSRFTMHLNSNLKGVNFLKKYQKPARGGRVV